MEPLWGEILCSNENAVLRLCYQPPAQTCNSAQEMWNENRKLQIQSRLQKWDISTDWIDALPWREKVRMLIQMCKVAASQNTWCIQKGAALDMLLSGALELLGYWWLS